MRKVLFLLLIVPSVSFAGNFCVPIPDAIEGRVVDAMAYKHGYKDTLKTEDNREVPNPQTKQQFLRQYFKTYFEKVTQIYEAEVASKAEFDRVKELAESEVILP